MTQLRTAGQFLAHAVDWRLVEAFLEAQREAPQEIVLDLDWTDGPLHSEQEERFFHGY